MDDFKFQYNDYFLRIDEILKEPDEPLKNEELEINDVREFDSKEEDEKGDEQLAELTSKDFLSYSPSKIEDEKSFSQNIPSTSKINFSNFKNII